MISYTTFSTLLSVACVWFLVRKNRQHNFIPDSSRVDLSDTFPSVTYEYMKNLKQSFRIEPEESKVAAEVIKHILGREVPEEAVLIGSDITSIYKLMHNLTGDSRVVSSEITIFNLRDILGINGEIAVFGDLQLRERISRELSEYDQLSKVVDLLDTQTVVKLATTVKKILEYRWEQITSRLQSSLSNAGGSYAYLDTLINDEVYLLKTSRGYRLNMLCSNAAFNTLIERLDKPKHTVMSF